MLYFAWLKNSWIEGFWPILTPSGWFLGLGLFQNKFQNLLIYTNKFCFGYIAVSCFFETFPGGRAGLGGWQGWVAGWKIWFFLKTKLSALTLTLTLDFDLGFVNISKLDISILKNTIKKVQSSILILICNLSKFQFFFKHPHFFPKFQMFSNFPIFSRISKFSPNLHF